MIVIRDSGIRSLTAAWLAAREGRTDESICALSAARMTLGQDMRWGAIKTSEQALIRDRLSVVVRSIEYICDRATVLECKTLASKILRALIEAELLAQDNEREAEHIKQGEIARKLEYWRKKQDDDEEEEE